MLPYLALLRAGFCLPPMLPPARCALTAPFHPYPTTREARNRAVYFLCHCPSSCPDRALPGALPCGVRTFLSPEASEGRESGRSSSALRHLEYLMTTRSRGLPPSSIANRQSPIAIGTRQSSIAIGTRQSSIAIGNLNRLFPE